MGSRVGLGAGIGAERCHSVWAPGPVRTRQGAVRGPGGPARGTRTRGSAAGLRRHRGARTPNAADARPFSEAG